MSDDSITVAIRVQPGASRTRVGGRRGDSLVVAVTARAVDGAATAAALAAVAEALGLRPRQVTLLQGARHRDKVLRLEVEPRDRAHVLAQLERLHG